MDLKKQNQQAPNNKVLVSVSMDLLDIHALPTTFMLSRFLDTEQVSCCVLMGQFMHLPGQCQGIKASGMADVLAMCQASHAGSQVRAAYRHLLLVSVPHHLFLQLGWWRIRRYHEEANGGHQKLEELDGCRGRCITCGHLHRRCKPSALLTH